jgi:hypothetical protein
MRKCIYFCPAYAQMHFCVGVQGVASFLQAKKNPQLGGFCPIELG